MDDADKKLEITLKSLYDRIQRPYFGLHLKLVLTPISLLVHKSLYIFGHLPIIGIVN